MVKHTQTIRQLLLTNCLSVFDHPVGLALKACVCYFLSNSYFSPNDSPSKTMKNVFLFHLESSLRSQDIQMYVFTSSPLFSLSAIALEIDPR